VAPLTVVVAGAMANKPANGGEAWVRLSWVRGLQRLGCDVWFVEEIQERHCTDDLGGPSPFASSVNLRWFREMTAEFGLTDRAWLCCDTGAVEGPATPLLEEVASGALLVNISGHLRDPDLKALFAKRAYVDIDPGFTQIWHAQGNAGARLEGHDVHFTIGANIGSSHCSIPSDAVRWRHVRPPVVLADWPVSPSSAFEQAELCFSTIATWRGPFGPIEFDRRRFGLKVHEFRKYIELPRQVPARFEAALAIHASEVSDLELLAENGWYLVDPASVAGTPQKFAAYVRASGAEFSVAQGVYVETRSGWFSDRTTRYLSSGRPVLVQDTGFSDTLPVGKGLVTFTTPAEAIAGAQAIIEDHDAHSLAAREIAETYFGSDEVLTGFLQQCEDS